MGYKFCLSDISSFPLSLLQKKMAAKSWSTTSESEHERLGERHRMEMENHHHNSKAVRKRFSILLSLGWLLKAIPLRMLWHCSTTQKTFCCCFLAHDNKETTMLYFYLQHDEKKRWFSFFSFHTAISITVSITVL